MAAGMKANSALGNNVAFILLVLSSCVSSEPPNQIADYSAERSPAEELKSFYLEPGLRIELVASEPMVQDPVVITFDEDGRLWVVEMRGFMPTIDGDGERERVGRVSVLEDTTGDGRMDISTIYLDSLIMPRAIALIRGGALIVEQEALWLTRDIDHDLRADTKTLIDPDYAGNKFPEHSGNGLWRGVDSWYYNAKSRFRYKLIDGTWRRDSTELRGQWGISHDDAGRLFYNYNWSQLHADLVPPEYFSRNKNHTPTTGIDHGLTIDRRIYPIRPNPAVNRGYIPGTLDEKGRLLEFTAACSPLVYRSHALPSEFLGNVFVCEPSGNLIKRNVIESNGVLLAARDPHPGKEFLASNDERFRPVHLATGPDGALYVADMYRGLIQHGAYVTPYLREQTLKRKLVQPIHRGRIWRIVPEGQKPPQNIKLSEATSAELVEYLSHPDGWYRDMAQRLLIERKDSGVDRALMHVALSGTNDLGRFHALWTLDGLNRSNPDLLVKLVADKNDLVSATALRLVEPFAKTNARTRSDLEDALLNTAESSRAFSALQITLTANVLSRKVSHQLLYGMATRYDTSALFRDAIVSSLQDQELIFLQKLLREPEWNQQSPSKEIFLEMLTSCVVKQGNPADQKTLLSILENNQPAFGWRERAILTGMSIHGRNPKIKRVKLPSAPDILSRNDLGIAPDRLRAITSLFEWPGSVSSDSTLQKQNVLSEQEQKQFALGRQYYLNTCSGCHGSDGAGLNRFAPPLQGSEWVTGDERKLVLILLHGIEGPLEVSGKMYNTPEILPVMPGHSTLDDAYIASILTYIRNEWGNQAKPVTRRTVGTIRHTTQGRVVPWSVEELNKHVAEVK
jgi:mono/diheme cytochrome c family protein/glucose/arabinose dehydrogenase